MEGQKGKKSSLASYVHNISKHDALYFDIV